MHSTLEIKLIILLSLVLAVVISPLCTRMHTHIVIVIIITTSRSYRAAHRLDRGGIRATVGDTRRIILVVIVAAVVRGRNARGV